MEILVRHCADTSTALDDGIWNHCVAPLLATLDRAAKKHFQFPAERHVRFPQFRVIDVEAKEREVGIIFASRKPCLDDFRPELVDHGRIIIDGDIARQARKEILSLGDKLRHRWPAGCQTIVLADEEPDCVDLIFVQLRG